jgi:hypothetical protein
MEELPWRYGQTLLLLIMNQYVYLDAPYIIMLLSLS